MNRKRIALGSLLVFLSFSLTGCPRYEYWEHYQNTATEQGTIHELAVINNGFGLFLEQGYTNINERMNTIYHDGVAIRDRCIRITSSYHIYNNEAARTVRFALPLTRTIDVGDVLTLPKISLHVKDQDGIREYDPMIAMGDLFYYSHENIGRGSNTYADILQEVEEKKNITLETLYRYEGHWQEEPLTFAWKAKTEEEKGPIFLFEEGVKEIQNELGTYTIIAEEDTTKFVFYSTYDFRSIWSSEQVSTTEISYTEFINFLAIQLGLNAVLASSYFQYYVDLNASRVTYYSLSMMISNYLLSSHVYLQNYLLIYDVPLLGNNQDTKLQIVYESKMEKSNYGYEIAHSLSGLNTFLKVNSYQCVYQFHVSTSDSLELQISNRELSLKKDDNDFILTLENEGKINDYYAIFMPKDKTSEKIQSGCTSFRLSAKLIFGGLFVFLFVLIELSYRRKKHAK